jgi:phosphate transport system protein
MTREHYLRQLAGLSSDVDDLGRRVIGTIRASIDALEALDVASAQRIIESDVEINASRHRIDETAFLVLATQQPTAIDLRVVMSASRVAGELERIADYSTGISKLTLTMAGEPKGDPTPQIRPMAEITIELLGEALVAFRDGDLEAAGAVWRRDDEVDDLYEEFFRFQIDDMVEHKKRVRRGTYMLWVAHNLERMSDRVTNIAETVAFVVTADVASWRSQIEAETIPLSR